MIEFKNPLHQLVYERARLLSTLEYVLQCLRGCKNTPPVSKEFLIDCAIEAIERVYSEETKTIKTGEK